ncbi:MAG: hypothetical protein K5928_03635 [Prevotella sp.]|nr:hypothetical protein [Prevotella sp.]
MLACLWLTAFCVWPAVGRAQQDYYKKPDDSKILSVKTRYNYAPLAAEITAGCETDYERIRAIYQWICEHIAYDTSFKIRSADECLKKQKGVCQAYCELFYMLAKSVDIRVETLEGKAKDQTGFINPAGHGWLFAYTRADHGILLDPTWGAGSVANGQFVRDDDIWPWFNVAPEWMIFSHYPDDAACQLLDKPMTLDDFLALPPANPLWKEYGLDVHKIYVEARARRLALPHLYNHGERLIELSDIPYSASLRIGTQYTFRIKIKAAGQELAVWNDGYPLSKEGMWRDDGDGISSITVVPRETGTLSLMTRSKTEATWHTLAKYDIEPPTEADWSRLAQYFPASTPEIKAVKNLHVDEWNAAGIDEHRLVRLIREGHVKELPMLYSGKGQLLCIDNVPMNRQLRLGETYMFSFTPRKGFKWALVEGSNWQTDWRTDESGRLSLSVAPKAPGRLSLCVQLAEGESFWTCLEYEVVQ